MLEMIHISHVGQTKMYAAAKSRYFWPGMKEMVKNITESCDICKKLNPRPPANPNIEPERQITQLQPMESLGADIFSWKGIDYLLVVDRMSGYIFVFKLTKSTSSRVVEHINSLCLTYGYPKEFRFDKGPTFMGPFEEFLKDIRCESKPSSITNAQSNGLSESNVKNAKLLLRKTTEEKSNFQEALAMFNQVPRADGFSPSELFYGRRVR